MDIAEMRKTWPTGRLPRSPGFAELHRSAAGDELAFGFECAMALAGLATHHLELFEAVGLSEDAMYDLAMVLEQEWNGAR